MIVPSPYPSPTGRGHFCCTPLAHRVSVRTREKKERNRTRSYEALTSNGLYKSVDFYDTIKRPKNDIFGIIKRLKSDIFGTEEAYKSLMETQRSADINTHYSVSWPIFIPSVGRFLHRKTASCNQGTLKDNHSTNHILQPHRQLKQRRQSGQRHVLFVLSQLFELSLKLQSATSTRLLNVVYA